MGDGAEQIGALQREARAVHLWLAPFVWFTVMFLVLCFWPIRDPSGRAVISRFPFACFMPLLIPVHMAAVLAFPGSLPWFRSRSAQSALQRFMAVGVYLGAIAGVLIATRPETPMSGWSVGSAYVKFGMLSTGPVFIILGSVGRLPFPSLVARSDS